MSSATPGQRIGVFRDQETSGRCKLNRGLNARRTSGTETGEGLGDLSLVHVLASREEAERVSKFLPGVDLVWDLSYGQGSDGRRSAEWAPVISGCDLVFSSVERGIELYAGPAEIRRCVLRCSEKAATLTVFVRLHGPPKVSIGELYEALGSAVDYEVTRTADDVTGSTGAKDADGGLPFGGGAKRGGDIVVRAGDVVHAEVDEEDVVGRALSVSEAGVVVLGPPMIWPTDDDIYRMGSVEVQPGQVVTVTPICGPKGGSADGAIEKIAKRAEEADAHVGWDDIVEAIVDLADRGVIERGENGWPLTSEVVDALFLPPEA